MTDCQSIPTGHRFFIGLVLTTFIACLAAGFNLGVLVGQKVTVKQALKAQAALEFQCQHNEVRP